MKALENGRAAAGGCQAPRQVTGGSSWVLAPSPGAPLPSPCLDAGPEHGALSGNGCSGQGRTIVLNLSLVTTACGVCLTPNVLELIALGNC